MKTDTTKNDTTKADAAPTQAVTTFQLEFHRLTRRGRNGQALLDGATGQIEPGDRVALSGPSGTGKTLLLRAIAQLDPLDAGEVLWNGHVTAPASIPEFRSQVMYLAQRPALFPGDVRANLAAPWRLQQYRRQAQRPLGDDMALSAWTLAAMETLELDEAFLNKDARELSGGEAQICCLLRALQLKPRVLLLDEPTASLDAAAAMRVEKLLQERVDEHQAFVWVSHSQSQARRVATRHWQMKEGGSMTLDGCTESSS